MESRQRWNKVSARLAGLTLFSVGILLTCLALFFFSSCNSASDGFTYQRVIFGVGNIETIFEWGEFYKVAGISGAIGLAGLGMSAIGVRMLRASVSLNPLA